MTQILTKDFFDLGLDKKRLKQRKTTKTLTTKDIYRDHYPYKDKEDKKYVDYITFSKIIRAYAKIATQELIEKGSVGLPGILGKLKILRFKSFKSKKVDWAYFRRTGEIRMFDNLHSGGWLAKCHWIKTVSFGNYMLFKFKLSRTNNSLLSNSIRSEQDSIYKYDVSSKYIKIKNNIEQRELNQLNKEDYV